jgi:hypothetical protein
MLQVIEISSTRTWLFFVLVSFLLSPAYPGYSQKVVDQKIWTSYQKSPVMALTPEYNSYSIMYDFGDLAITVNERPNLPGLKYKKTDGDLLLKLLTEGIL